MTILVKKVFISSKPTFVCLLCPPLCGPFSIQESAAGGLSYKAKKSIKGKRCGLSTALDTLFLMALIINKGKWLLVAFLPLWYNERRYHPYTGTERGCATMSIFSSFLLSVLASVVAYYICKWLDGDK